MPVTIDEITTDVSVDRGPQSASGGGPTGPAEDEVRIEELRTVIRELVREEVERQLRLAMNFR